MGLSAGKYVRCIFGTDEGYFPLNMQRIWQKRRNVSKTHALRVLF